jgi:hypothetical protein
VRQAKIRSRGSKRECGVPGTRRNRRKGAAVKADSGERFEQPCGVFSEGKGGARGGVRGLYRGKHWWPVMAPVTPGSNAGERYWEGERMAGREMTGGAGLSVRGRGG